jgi:YVTN family beta-propeller protein
MKNLMFVFLFSFFTLSVPLVCFSQASGYKLIEKINVPGDGKWDFVTFDNTTRRLYISHGTIMQVVDVDKKSIVGEVQGTMGIHGIALAPDQNKGFTSNGKDTSVTVFNLKTFETIKKIKLIGSCNPDHLIYDPFSKKIFVFNNKSSDVSIIDPVSNNILKTIKLGGMPELAVSDNKGQIFVNLEDKNEIAVLDAKTLQVKKHWSLAPGEEPTGLAIDIKNNRLFAGCSNKMLVILDAATGKVINTQQIGERVDGIAYDPLEKLIFSSNGEGTVTIIKQNSKDKYSVIDSVVTQKGAKTIALDKTKHYVYIPSAEYSFLTEKPSIIPNTFGILIIGK